MLSVASCLVLLLMLCLLYLHRTCWWWRRATSQGKHIMSHTSNLIDNTHTLKIFPPFSAESLLSGSTSSLLSNRNNNSKTHIVYNGTFHWALHHWQIQQQTKDQYVPVLPWAVRGVLHTLCCCPKSWLTHHHDSIPENNHEQLGGPHFSQSLLFSPQRRLVTVHHCCRPAAWRWGIALSISRCWEFEV